MLYHNVAHRITDSGFFFKSTHLREDARHFNHKPCSSKMCCPYVSLRTEEKINPHSSTDLHLITMEASGLTKQQTWQTKRATLTKPHATNKPTCPTACLYEKCWSHVESKRQILPQFVIETRHEMQQSLYSVPQELSGYFTLRPGKRFSQTHSILPTAKS